MLRLEENIQKVRDLCEKHNVLKLYLFGSATNSSFSDRSDIDFIVDFDKTDLSKYFENYLSFKEKLSKLFNRDIDLIEEQTLRNPVLILSINRSKKLIYGLKNFKMGV